jgi:hypothetical protein
MRKKGWVEVDPRSKLIRFEEVGERNALFFFSPNLLVRHGVVKVVRSVQPTRGFRGVRCAAKLGGEPTEGPAECQAETGSPVR